MGEQSEICMIPRLSFEVLLFDLNGQNRFECLKAEVVTAQYVLGLCM